MTYQNPADSSYETKPMLGLGAALAQQNELAERWNITQRGNGRREVASVAALASNG